MSEDVTPIKEQLPTADDWAVAIAQALEGADETRVRRLIEDLHPARLADVLETLPEEERLALWRLVEPPRLKGEALIQTAPGVRECLIAASGVEELIAAVVDLELDELADLYPELPGAVVDAVVRAMDHSRRQRFSEVLAFPPDTAGGLMDADALAVRSDLSLEAVLRYLRLVRQRQGQLPEHTHMLAVIGRDHDYLGALPLSDLASLDPRLTVGEVMDPAIEAIPALTPANRVARQFEDQDLISAAVVDQHGKLIGRITVDDVVDVIRGEGERTIRQRAGLDEKEEMFAPILTSTRRRGVWLAVNLVQAFAASYVIGLFDATIQQMVALAVLMPIVASMGSVAGVQTLTLVTRGLAVEQVGRANTRRLLRHELGIGALNGLIWGSIMSAIVIAWFQDLRLGAIFAVALLFNLVNAALSGTVIPLFLDRYGIDPAVAGGVALTAATDILGFFCFLGLATLILL